MPGGNVSCSHQPHWKNEQEGSKTHHPEHSGSKLPANLGLRTGRGGCKDAQGLLRIHLSDRKDDGDGGRGKDERRGMFILDERLNAVFRQNGLGDVGFVDPGGGENGRYYWKIVA